MLYDTHIFEPHEGDDTITAISGSKTPRHRVNTATPGNHHHFFLNISHQFCLSHYTTTNLTKTFQCKRQVLHQETEPSQKPNHISYTTVKSHQIEQQKKQPPRRNMQASEKPPGRNKFLKRSPFFRHGRAMHTQNASISPQVSLPFTAHVQHYQIFVDKMPKDIGRYAVAICTCSGGKAGK